MEIGGIYYPKHNFLPDLYNSPPKNKGPHAFLSVEFPIFQGPAGQQCG